MGGGGGFLWQIIMYITDKRMRRPDYQWVTSTLSKYAQTLTGFAMSSDISLSTFASVASWQILTRSTVATRSIIAFIYIFNKTNTIFFLLLQHTKRRHLQKYEKKRYVHYSLLIVQMISCSQYNTYASYKFDTVYYLQHLHYLQYNTYDTYNTILILLIILYLYYLQ